jgi:hypothetical protein
MEGMTRWRLKKADAGKEIVPLSRRHRRLASAVLFGAMFILCLGCGLLESRVWHVKLFGGKTEG